MSTLEQIYCIANAHLDMYYFFSRSHYIDGLFRFIFGSHYERMHRI